MIVPRWGWIVFFHISFIRACPVKYYHVVKALLLLAGQAFSLDYLDPNHHNPGKNTANKPLDLNCSGKNF